MGYDRLEIDSWGRAQKNKFLVRGKGKSSGRGGEASKVFSSVKRRYKRRKNEGLKSAQRACVIDEENQRTGNSTEAQKRLESGDKRFPLGPQPGWENGKWPYLNRFSRRKKWAWWERRKKLSRGRLSEGLYV